MGQWDGTIMGQDEAGQGWDRRDVAVSVVAARRQQRTATRRGTDTCSHQRAPRAQPGGRTEGYWGADWEVTGGYWVG